MCVHMCVLSFILSILIYVYCKLIYIYIYIYIYIFIYIYNFFQFFYLSLTTSLHYRVMRNVIALQRHFITHEDRTMKKEIQEKAEETITEQ